jgi:hypothetical protein
MPIANARKTVAALLASTALLFAACGDDGEEPEDADDAAEQEETAEDPAVEQFCEDLLAATAGEIELADIDDPPEEIAEALAAVIADETDQDAGREVANYLFANCGEGEPPGEIPAGEIPENEADPGETTEE